MHDFSLKLNVLLQVKLLSIKLEIFPDFKACSHGAFFTARKRSCGKVMFLQACVILFTGGHACFFLGGGCVLFWGVCVLFSGGHAFFLGVRGFFWGGVWFFQGCMVFSGGHVWFFWGCMVFFEGGHAWFLGGACMVFWGACMVFLGGMHGFFRGHAWFFLGDTVNEQAVRILLECILVFCAFAMRKMDYVGVNEGVHMVQFQVRAMHWCV